MKLGKKKEEEKKDEKKDDEKKEDEDDEADEGDGTVFLEEEDPTSSGGANAFNADVQKLHRFLNGIETPSIRDDYHRKRRWRFTVSKITFLNDGDYKMSLFIAMTITDDRPPAPWLASCHSKFCGPSAPLDEIRAVTRYSPAISGINPQQKVHFPGVMAFRDWGITKEMALGCVGLGSGSASGGQSTTSGHELRMSYADILKRSLRIEIWEYKPVGAHALLGSQTMPLSSIVHAPPPREMFFKRNVAPTGRGRSTNIGMLTFNTVLEEATLQHVLSLKCWSIALSNSLMHPSFRHPLSADCSAPCCCAAVTCCCNTPTVVDTLQQWGYGETVSVAVTAPGARITLRGHTTTKRSLGFSAPMNSIGMAAAASTPSHRMAVVPPGLDEAVASNEAALASSSASAVKKSALEGSSGGAGGGAAGGVTVKPADVTPSPLPANDSVSYSELKVVGDPQQCLMMNCSRSSVSY